MNHSIEDAITQLANGGIIILADDSNREDEGDFICASELVTADTINFMITVGRGLVCQAITAERAREMQLPLMAENNNALHHTNFTISIDYRYGTTTGISCPDRAATIRALADSKTVPEDFARPGHIFPLIAHPGGLNMRRGHTEASVLLAHMAGLQPNAVICEILNPDGTMARGEQLEELSREHGLPFINIQQLTEYIKEKDYDFSANTTAAR